MWVDGEKRGHDASGTSHDNTAATATATATAVATPSDDQDQSLGRKRVPPPSKEKDEQEEQDVFHDALHSNDKDEEHHHHHHHHHHHREGDEGTDIEMNVSTNIDVMTSLDSVTLSTPASRSAEEPLTPHGQGQPIELMDSKFSVYSASSTKPGVVKTTRQMKKTETMKFFTSQLSKKHRTRRKCMQCSYARKGFAWYQKAFRYVVLFKWLRWSLRKKLNIPKLITFWMSIVIGVAWIYNGVLFSQSEQMHRGDDSCIQQCSIILGSSCIDEYEDLNDRRKATAKFFIINSFYITFCAIFSIHRKYRFGRISRKQMSLLA